MALTWMKTLELGVALRQGVVAKRDDVLPFYEYHRVYIYSPETWETIETNVSIEDSISNQPGLNLKIHGPHGPNAHAGADLQAFLNLCFKPNSLTAH